MAHQNRKLLAIASADVVGYSRLMQEDEVGTHALLKLRFQEIVSPGIGRHGGRIVKLMGDGVLAEFPSVVGAAEWAVETQVLIAKANAANPGDKRIEYRIGINLGDVIVEDDDIFGDGVNLAARLQEVSETGGVCISDSAFGQVRGKIKAEFADGGEVSLKNIAGRVRIWRWSPHNTPSIKIVDVSKPVPGFGGRPAIAVLAFANMSRDPEQEFLADGISEDILTRLAMWRWLPVIARNSSFTYKGRAVDVKKVGQELGARYILEGSVRREGDRVRVTGQLIDAETGHHVWADRYDRDLDDIFALQDQITDAVVAALEPAVGRAEMLRAQRKAPASLDAWDLYQRGMSQVTKATREGLDAARELFRGSSESDPSFAPPHAGMVLADFIDNTVGLTADGDELRRSANASAFRAVSLDDVDPFAHAALAYASFWNGNHAAAITAGRRSVELNPSFALGHHALGAAFFAAGEPEASIAAVRTAIRISPNDPWLFLFLGLLSASLYMHRDCVGAAEAAGIGVQRFPWYASIHRWHAVALAQLGHTAEAKLALEKFLELTPHFSFTAAKRSYTFQRPIDLAHYLEGLSKAGLPRDGSEK